MSQILSLVLLLMMAIMMVKMMIMIMVMMMMIITITIKIMNVYECMSNEYIWRISINVMQIKVSSTVTNDFN